MEESPHPPKNLNKWFVGEDIILPFFIGEENLHFYRKMTGSNRGSLREGAGFPTVGRKD